MISVDVVRVFVNSEGNFGNPLGIVQESDVPDAHMQQKLARYLGYSETVFVRRDEHDPSHAYAKIFTPTMELPFAGHPSIGISWWLEEQDTPISVLTVPAGDLPVEYDEEFIRITSNPEYSPQFDYRQVSTVEEVLGFDEVRYRGGSLYLWAYINEQQGMIRARMLGPELGVVEDEATGSAATRFTGLQRRDLHIIQGKGSELFTRYINPEKVVLSGRVQRAQRRTINLQEL